jgi:DNA-binding MarR family transcriptional regulator/GNAT superfamily N-acetyltransferase
MSPGTDVVRRFNRDYTRRIGVLHGRYLGQARPLAEARLLFEIGRHGRRVQGLRRDLGLDSGYLARLLRSLERQGLVEVEPDPADGRARLASLTVAGVAELDDLDARSDALADALVASLGMAERAELVAHLDAVHRLLRGAEVTIDEVDAGSPDLRHCLLAYADELAARFPEGYRASDLLGPDQIRAGGTALVARERGRPVGCGVLRPLPGSVDSTGEVKHLWVEPEARGLGVGRRLLHALEQSARARGMRRVRLDTHAVLTEAIHLYQTTGYRHIPSYGANPHAHRWFEKPLRATTR